MKGTVSPAPRNCGSPTSVQHWVGSFYPGQIKDIYEEITQGKPRGEITGGK